MFVVSILNYLLFKAVDFDSATAELLAERTRKALEEQRNAEKLQKVDIVKHLLLNRTNVNEEL